MRTLPLMVLTAALMVTACGGGSEEAKAPEGQVVAEVGGHEVTARELAMELRGTAITDPQILKAAERAALAAIINRKILANAAREQGLDDRAEFQLAKHRSEELLLAQEMQRQIAAKVPRPSREEAERYMAAHPNNFGQRKIYTVDQIQFSLPNSGDKLKEFAPLSTLEQIEQKLLSEGTEYRKAPASIDTRNLPPHVADQIAKVPAGEVFIIPAGQTVVANRVRETQVSPFTGEAAIAMAQQMLFRERLTEALAKQAEELRKQAGNVNYKEGYGPPPANAPKLSPTAPADGEATPAAGGPA